MTPSILRQWTLAAARRPVGLPIVLLIVAAPACGGGDPTVVGDAGSTDAATGPNDGDQQVDVGAAPDRAGDTAAALGDAGDDAAGDAGGDAGEILWSAWGPWSACSRPCDGGTQTRQRTCQLPAAPATPCGEPQVETRACREFRCADPVRVLPLTSAVTPCVMFGDGTLKCVNARTYQTTGFPFEATHLFPVPGVGLGARATAFAALGEDGVVMTYAGRGDPLAYVGTPVATGHRFRTFQAIGLARTITLELFLGCGITVDDRLVCLPPDGKVIEAPLPGGARPRWLALSDMECTSSATLCSLTSLAVDTERRIYWMQVDSATRSTVSWAPATFKLGDLAPRLEGAFGSYGFRGFVYEGDLLVGSGTGSGVAYQLPSPWSHTLCTWGLAALVLKDGQALLFTSHGVASTAFIAMPRTLDINRSSRFFTWITDTRQVQYIDMLVPPVTIRTVQF